MVCHKMGHVTKNTYAVAHIHSEFEYVPVSETEVYCSTGMLMDPDDGRKSVRVFVSV